MEIEKCFTFWEIWPAAGEKIGEIRRDLMDFLRKYDRFHYLRKNPAQVNFGHDRKKTIYIIQLTSRSIKDVLIGVSVVAERTRESLCPFGTSYRCRFVARCPFAISRRRFAARCPFAISRHRFAALCPFAHQILGATPRRVVPLSL